MADETDPLVQAMIDAGLYPQRLRPLQQQYQMGQQFMEPQQAQGRNVGQTYVAASPWEHLSNAIRQVIGAKMASGALQKEQGLTGSLGAGRQAYVQALQRAGGQQSPETPQMLGRPPDQQETNRLAMMGAASGDPGMENAAKTAMQMQHNQNELARLGNTQQYQQSMVDLKNREQWNGTDMFGNPISRPKHSPSQKPSAIPNAVEAAGGGAAQPAGGGGALGANTAPGGGDPAKTFPFGKSGPSQAAIDKLAEVLAVTGSNPPGRWGRATATINSAIANRAFELYPDIHLAGNKADYASNQNALRKLQVAQDSLESFEKGMLQNGRLMLDTAKGIVDTGSPLFNQPIRAWKFAAGDPNAAKFNAARQVFVQEASKVLGGAVQGGGVTEGQRHEAEGLMRGDMTIPQMEATLQTLEADAANRKKGAAQQIEAIRARMNPQSGSAAPQAAPAAAPPAPAANAPVLSPKDAAAIDWAKKNPGDPRAQKILQAHGAGP